jgi:hypothetical protein
MSDMSETSEYPKVLRIYLELRQYPILARPIREQMREELFSRGIITPEQFEAEVEQQAVKTQKMEGITNPLYEESASVWSERLRILRERLTDFYFAYNLPHELFEEIVQRTIRRRRPDQKVVLAFNPELAPWDILFAQGERYEALPPEKRAAVSHHLQEIIVVLIKGMISDQLAFIGIAKEFFTVSDLHQILDRRIGRGKIGGKAAGMLLAWKILQREAGRIGNLDLKEHLSIPESYFVGADVFYDFLVLNGLYEFMNQKYRERHEIEADYPEILKAYLAGKFPPTIVRGLRRILEEVGDVPLIVRSSSLLEDNFGYAFSGKYESHFCPNQGTLDENLEDLQTAIRRVYASVLNPDALFYRRQQGLLDYDERMAILLQKVEGHGRDGFFYPTLAGVAFSRNPHRWNPRIRPEDGFVRLVLGIGTRAVERVANDYPRMIALSHPTLRPESSAQQIKRYSQHFVDLIDLEENDFKTVPVSEAKLDKIGGLRFLVSVDQGDYVQPMITGRSQVSADRLVLTFDELLRKTEFVPLLREMLQVLETHYKRPVDVEFAADLAYDYPTVDLKLTLLQCRPLSRRAESRRFQIPTDIPNRDILFTATQMVPHGAVRQIEYIVYVDPLRYARIPDNSTRLELARVIGRLNRQLEGHTFILMGPGRWGSANIELGVKVTYADIFNCRALIEIAMPKESGRPEVSYGTHFFQDLVESNIFPLALYPGEPGVIFNAGFLDRAPNALAQLLPTDAPRQQYVKVIRVPAAGGGRYLQLVMNADQERAIAYLE